MQLKRNWAAWLLSLATLLLAALLIVQCAQIYIAGNAPENFDVNGARLRDLFSREEVSSRLRSIAWAFWLWLGALLLGVIFRTQSKPLPMDAKTRLALIHARVIPTAEMQAEEARRKRAAAICGAICLFCGILALVWLLLPGSFDSWDLETELAAMLIHLSPLALVCFGSLLVRGEFARKSMLREIDLAKSAPKRGSILPMPEAKNHNILRAALYIAAIALVIAGISNGGMRDVLVKAINICTECIGLG